MADFGIAKMLKVKEMTQTAVIMGTPNYIAPELVRNTGYDHRVDVFSLGVTMYEILAGRRPFDADSDYAIIYKVASEEAVPLNELRDDLPDDLVSIVHRALEKNPDRRYPSMKELKENLMKVRGDLGMAVNNGEGERFDKEEALHRELEAARGLDETSLDEEALEGPGFSRDEEWKKLIARVYHGGEEGDGDSPATAPTEMAEVEMMTGRGEAPLSTRRVARLPAGAATGTPHSRVPARKKAAYSGEYIARPSGDAGTAALQQVKHGDHAATMRWSGLLMGTGALTIISVVLPWIGEALNPGTALAGVRFPEGVVAAVLSALILGAGALLILGVGKPGTWLKAVKPLSLLCLLAIIISIPLRVVMGLGYDQAAGLRAVDYLKGTDYGLWLSLVFSILTYWACRKTKEAAA